VRGPTHLALAWLWAHRGRTVLVVLCVALTLLLPLAVGAFVDDYARALTARARETPLVVGAPGSRFDLVLTTLHFRGRLPRPTNQGELLRSVSGDFLRTEATAGELGTAIPLHVVHAARGLPVVGTSPEYYELRGLRPAAGTRPLRLGEATLGAEAARATGLAVGGRLLTDEAGLFEFGMKQPLRLRVVGVFAARGTPDDRAVFVDVKTCWVLDGLGHGHAEPGELPPGQVVGREKDGAAVLGPAVVEAQEITPENAASIHFHGDPATYPLTSILVLPKDERAGTILKGRYRVTETAQALEPTQVVQELLGLVFQVKAFFDANVLLVSVATALLLGLVFLLTLRVRRRELETLARIGCSRATLVRILATEWAVMLVAGVGLAALLAKTLLTVFLRDLVP
jgi:putative ABC transport system permease protein